MWVGQGQWHGFDPEMPVPVTVNVIPEQRFTWSVSLPAPNAFGTAFTRVPFAVNLVDFPFFFSSWRNSFLSKTVVPSLSVVNAVAVIPGSLAVSTERQ